MLEFADDITIEPRFPTMNMALIQEIKNHPLADKEETDMSAVSIKVVIKGSDSK